MPPVEPTDLILRFRDLATPLGETIRRHRQKIEQVGHVLWGWWAKGGEVVPFSVFAKLRTAMNAAPRTVLLFDSFTGTVFKAMCSDIAWALDGSAIPSPDPDATPEYYRERSFPAWFKLTSIEANGAAPDVVRERAYVQVNEFFDSGSSKYTRFYGKRIFSVDELRQQDRTIWFVRAARDEDPAHEIRIEDAKALAPEHFASSFAEADYPCLLWLSDPHYSEDQTKHRFFKTVTTRTLEVALEEEIKRQKLQVGGMLVSGDITWSAKPDEFQMARESLGALAGRLRLAPYETGVCPGNHDLAFSADPSVKGAPVVEVGQPSRAAFEAFHKSMYFLKPNEHLASGRRFLFAGAIPVEIAILNSSALQQTEGLFQGLGFIGGPQLDAVATGMGWDKPKDVHPFRIVMLHHHLVPVSYRDPAVTGASYSVVLDAGAVLRWVAKHHVRLVLHGHMHQPFIARASVPLNEANPDAGWHEVYIAGMGSSGVSVDHLGGVGKNTFGALKFGVAGANLTAYSLHPTEESAPLWSVGVPYTQGAGC